MKTDRRSFVAAASAFLSGLFGVRAAQAESPDIKTLTLKQLPRPLKGLRVMTAKSSRWMKCSVCGLHRPFDHWRDANLDLDRNGPPELLNPFPMFIADCPGMHGAKTFSHEPGARMWLELVEYTLHHIEMKQFNPYDIEVVLDPLTQDVDYYYVPRDGLYALLFEKKDGYFWKTMDWQLIRAVAEGRKFRLDSRNVYDIGDCGKPKAELDRIQYGHISGKITL